MPTYSWASASEFLGRATELARLEQWWADDRERMPMSLYGRRRCGKSWLLRRFAHGKNALVLVGRRTVAGAQMDDLAAKLEPVVGVKPSLRDLPELIRVLYRAARTEPLLVVLDEFPYLLGSTEAETDRMLTGIAAVMEEERDTSQLKLVLCGSLISQMEALNAERGPLHGRLLSLQLHPVAFEEARLFMSELSPVEQMERFAIAGGMPRYLSALGSGKELGGVLSRRVLDPDTALWNECRTVLEQELREPKVYFALLQALASGDKDTGELAGLVRSTSQVVSKYLTTLVGMRLVERRLPAGADATSRSGHWRLRDPFFRFWFRFVFPYQDDLEAGLPPETLWSEEIQPVLSEHVSWEFEDHCRRWVRSTQAVTRVDPWWGNALNALRRTKQRSSEEIDVVGTARNRVVLVGEAKWRSQPMGKQHVDEIEAFKLPAMRQAGLKIMGQPQVYLFSRGGYTQELRELARGRPELHLVEVETMLETSSSK